MDEKPDDVNDLVPLGSRVSEGIAEAFGLEVDVLRPLLLESSMRGSRFDVVPLDAVRRQ